MVGYLEGVLKNCTDERVLEEMVDGGSLYVGYIREKVADKLLEWVEEMSDDKEQTQTAQAQPGYSKNVMYLEYITEIVNSFCGTEGFTV